MSQLNPFGAFNDPFGQAAPLPPPQAPPVPPISEEDRRNILEKIGSAGLGGLSAIAGAINKPGRAVRGLLGGNLREALNLIPFSDALGITDPTQEVHGHDILRNLGVHNEKDPSLFSPAGAAGFGVDVLTDPLTYLSFGGHALTKAGLAAKKAGTLPATVAERAAQGLGGHVGVGLPFGGNAAVADLAPLGNAINRGVRAVPGGNAIADFAGNIGSAVGDLYNRTIPPLFQGSVMGQTDPIAQAAARRATERLPGAQASSRNAVKDLVGKLPSVAAGGVPTLEEGRLLRQGLESLQTPSGALEPVITGQRALQEADLARANELGHPDLLLSDPSLGYAKRSTVFSPQETAGFGSSMKPQGQPARVLPQGIPTEGPNSINALSRDPDLVPLRQKYVSGDKQPWLDAAKKGLGVDQAAIDAMRQNPAMKGSQQLADLEAKAVAAENTADWIARSVPESLALAKTPLGAFDVHPLVDLDSKLAKSAMRFVKTEALHESVAGMAYLGGEGVPLSKVLSRAGLTYKDSAGNYTALQRTLEAMQKQGKIGPNATLADLADWHIPSDQADMLTRFTKSATTPEGLKPFLKIWDSITNFTKAFQTTIWPANYARNKGQAIYQNFVTDGFNAQASGAMRYVKPYQDANAAMKGKIIEGSSQYPGLQHLTDEAATATLQSEMKNLNVSTAFKNPITTDIAGGDIVTRQLLPELPGQARKGVGEILRGAIPTSMEELKPWNIAGVGGRTEDVTSYVRAGRELSTESHAQDRIATYLAKRSQGYTPEAALQEVKLAHYDFANMSDFEKSIMKRVIPFYNFMRQNVPFVVKELTENPGGKLATTIKGVNAAKGDHPGFIPSQISGGIAAPLGAEENGQQRYLTHLGLGFEDLGSLTGPGGPLGMLNPLIKAPIESLTGKQLISGRDLADLHSRISDTTGITPPPLVENLLTNSPVGRVIGSASTFADPRKSILDKLLNLGTGARVSDVAVDASRRRAILDAITSQLHGPGVSRYENLSVRPEQFQNMNPFEQHLYQMYRSLNSPAGRTPQATTLAP